MRASISGQMTQAEELNEYRMSNKEFRMMKLDGHLRKPKRPFSVTPAKAGVQKCLLFLDSGACPGPRSGIRRNDRKGHF
jgi:hypothetical protein